MTNKYTRSAEEYWDAQLPDDDIIVISNTYDKDGTYYIENAQKYYPMSIKLVNDK